MAWKIKKLVVYIKRAAKDDQSHRLPGRQAIRYAISLFIIATMNFLIPRMMPGDPFVSLLGEEASTARLSLWQS
jgi:ABC-type dipeptide/oligopeptide/nickel transport system permease component